MISGKFLCCSIILLSLVHANIGLLDNMLTVAAPKWDNFSIGLQLKGPFKNNFTRCILELPLLKIAVPSFFHFQMVRIFEDPLVKIKKISEKVVSKAGKRFMANVSPAKLMRKSKCDKKYKYRSFDGSCNNLRTNWGKTNSSLVRLLLPRYASLDGDVVTTSVTGNPLPLPRYISTSIFPYADLPSTDFSLVVMQWGQIIAHDIGRTPSSIPIPVDCCAKVKIPVEQCFPIEIPEDDTFYSNYEQTCINMVRSLIDNDDCGCVPQQVAAVSHILDLSAMYGSDTVEAASLRQFKNGLMQISQSHDDRVFLPRSLDSQAECGVADDVCFRSGDSRVNQNLQLTCLHVVLLREHNRLAKLLKTVNAHWSDEELFQEARAILISQYQHIIYKEWLPIVLGKEYVTSHELLPLSTGNTKYRSDVNPSTINSFVTAAFRVFHSTVQGHIFAVDNEQCPYKSVNFSDFMSRPGIILEETNYDDFLRGLTAKPMQNLNRFVTEQLTQMMFHGDLAYGEDLISFDIQRGRDHGIPTYNNMRVLCGRSNATSFDDLIDDLGDKNVELLSSVYDDVADVDLFVGGILEKPVPGALVGPTFQCIIGEQFARKKFGDRFWYEVGGASHSFKKDQLQEIRKSSLSRLICDNSDNIDKIQPKSFRFATAKGNAFVSCSRLPSLNLSKWKEF